MYSIYSPITIGRVLYKFIVMDHFVYPASETLCATKRLFSSISESGLQSGGEKTSIHNNSEDDGKEERSREKKQKKERFAIFGLGNPGAEFVGTRHNVGFHCIESIAKKHGVELDKNKYECEYGVFTLGGHEVFLARPQSRYSILSDIFHLLTQVLIAFMNRSGHAVRYVSEMLKVYSSNIVVIYDDLYLPLGEFRLKHKAGAAGQKGKNSETLS